MLLVGLAATALTGCGPAAQLALTALDFRNIDPPTPRAYDLVADRAYWWQDADRRVWLALERDTPLPPGVQGRFTFRLSLQLEDLPAGRARNYAATPQTLRALVRIGPLESRFVSTRGIVALYREPAGRLRGSLRLEVQREAAQLFGGWGRPARYLLQGTFTAVQDGAAGAPIVAATESQGWGREPPLQSQPVLRD